MIFKVVVKANTGEQWEIPFESFSFSEELDKDRTANFRFNRASLLPIVETYSITIEYLFGGSFREIYIYDETDTVIYGGYISEMQFSSGENDLGNITVSSKGFFSLLQKRVTNSKRAYTADDSGDIAWDLINYTQGLTFGDFGITRGLHPATKDRDRTYRYKVIGEAIEDMSAVQVKEGFDFEIDNSKIFNIYYPEKGTYRNNLVLEEGFNIKTYNILKTFVDAMTNQVLVVGQGQDEDTTPVETRNAEDIYKTNFFLLQEIISEKDVTETTTLQDKGDQYLKNYKFPRFVVSCVVDYEDPLFTDYEVGDRLKLIIPAYNLNAYYRVIKRTCNEKGVVNLSFNSL